MKATKMNTHDVETPLSIGLKIGPPAAVAGAKMAEVDVALWIQWGTLLYLVLMIAHKLWRMGREAYVFWAQKRREPPADDA